MHCYRPRFQVLAGFVGGVGKSRSRRDDRRQLPLRSLQGRKGLAPGNHKSAGKKKKQRVTQGNNYLKTILCEVAWVIASHKKLYLSGWYWRLKQRTDSKRAIVALARKLLVIIYTMLKTNQPYNEQKFLERKLVSDQKRAKRMVNELTRLGYAVSLAA